MKVSKSSNMPLIFSFFSGSGFLDLGFEKSGFRVAFVNEIHSPFLDAYKYSRSKLNNPPPIYGYYNKDINELLSNDSDYFSKLIEKARTQKNIIGFIGGPPCPDFSIAGKNKGKEGENGKLSYAYIQLICKQKPDFFVFENVKGLYKTKKHKQFFDFIKNELINNGYECTEKLINSIEYGVPQDRERIILFGINKKSIKKNISEFNWLQNVKYPGRSAFNYSWPGQNFILNEKKLPPKELTIEYWFKLNDVENHQNAKNHFKPRSGLEKFKTLQEGDDSKKSYKRLHRKKYSPTAAYGNNEVHIHPTLPRRISASEALAIQSLPKEFTLPIDMTLSNMFKTIGNGVPFLAAKGIADAIKIFLENTR